MSDIKRVVLAYSGGLDTSVILKWLQVTYNCEVVTFTADLGQGEELEPARKKAEMFGIKDIRIVDIRDDRARELYGADLILLRPDLHVAWRGNRTPDQPRELTALVTGH